MRRVTVRAAAFTSSRGSARHDADGVSRGWRASAIRFAVGECSLGSILVAQSTRGICAILLGEDPDALGAICRTVSRKRSRGRRRDLRASGRAGRRFHRATGKTLDLPLDVRGTAFSSVSGRRCATCPPAPRRTTRMLHSASAHRVRPCRGAGVRCKPARGRDPVSSRRAQRWQHLGLSLGSRTQTHTARPRSAGSRRALAGGRRPVLIDGSAVGIDVHGPSLSRRNHARHMIGPERGTQPCTAAFSGTT